MSHPEKSSAETTSAPASAAGGQPAPREMNSGRVAFDSRGNAVWEWRTGDQQYAREVSTTLVQRLEAPGLDIAATGVVRAATGDGTAAATKTPGAQAGPAAASYNPYNHAAADSRRPRSGERVRSKTTSARAVPSPPAGPFGRLRRWFGFG